MTYKQYEIGEVLDTKVLVVPCVIAQEDLRSRCRYTLGLRCPHHCLVIQDPKGLHVIGYCRAEEKAHKDATGFLNLFKQLKKTIPTTTKEHPNMDKRKT